MDLGEFMKHQADNDSYIRWSTKYRTYLELGKWITSKLDEAGYNKIQIGADIMKHMLEEIKRYEELMNHTEMGKTMKELGTE